MLSRKQLIGFLSALVGSMVLLTSLTAQAQAQQGPRILYVDTNGQWQNDAAAYRDASRLIISSPGSPTNTVDNAVSLANYGDVIQVASGSYPAFSVLKKVNLVIQGAPGSPRPFIRANSSADDFTLINIAGSKYITVTGFEVTGKNANNVKVSGQDCNGIVIAPYIYAGEEVTSDHVYVRNCKVHDVGGGGIIALRAPNPRIDMGCDYVEITNNEICATNSTGQNAGSAVSLLVSRNSDGTGGYHNKIDSNRIYSNIINSNAALQSDCNGIIIDSNDLQDSPTNPSPGTLIQNNIVYNNSGRGIEVLDSSNITVLNNTVYKNNLSSVLPEKGELSIGGFNGAKPVHNVMFSNNVVQASDVANAATDAPAFHATGYLATDVIFKNNTYKSTAVPSYLGSDSGDYTTTMDHIDWNTTIESLVAYGELFNNPTPSNLGSADFGLKMLATRSGLSQRLSQTARDRGSKTANEYSFWSFNGVDRNSVNVPGGYIDRGAYEQ